MELFYDVSARIILFYEILINVISSILLVKYYKPFLIPKGKKHYLSLAGFGVTFFLLRYSIGFFISNSNEFPYMFVRIILMAGTIYLLSSIFFKKDLSKNIFLLCSFLAVQDICLFMSISLGRLFSNVGTLVFNNLWNNGLLSTEQQTTTYFNIFITANSAAHILLYTIVAIITLKHLANSFIYKNYSLRLSEIFSLILPCLSALAMTNIIRIIIFDPDGSGLYIYDKNPYINLLFFIAAAFLLSTMIVSVKLFQKTVQLHMEEKNAAVMQKQTQQIQEQMRDIDNIYGEIKGMRHDMKSHLSNIHLLVKSVIEGNQDVGKELEEYLGKFESTLNKFEFAFQTGNSISDVIIHQKYLEAVNNGIAFSADFTYPARLNLDIYDLAVILNNSLENAIEACNSMTQSDGFIRLYAYVKGEMFFIEIENSFTGQITFGEHSDLPSTNKSDKAAHGIGLSNIQRCARKYFGDIDIQISKVEKYSMFRLIVMLQGKA